MISTVILTKNEAHDLPACLESLDLCDDVHVLDSGSTDHTTAVAEAHGARVSHHCFESFGEQRNYALDHLPLKYPWVLFLDADEVAPAEFAAALSEAVQSAPATVAGFYCCWKLLLDNVWLRRCDSFPRWQFRVLRRGMARFTDFGHGQKECNVLGEIRHLSVPYLHYGFSKGWTHWVERHNRYSSQEAITRNSATCSITDMVSRDRSRRTAALKTHLTRLPGWPVLRFIHAYILKLGFLEGRPGFCYCCNISYYEFLIRIKMRELRAAPENPPPVSIPIGVTNSSHGAPHS